MTETSTRPVVLHSYLAYRDAPTALRFLEEAFGFTTTMQVPDEQGGIAHAELRLGDVAVVVFSDYDQYDRPQPKGATVGFGLYISVEQATGVDAFFARAVSAGASPVWEPAMSEWGNHRCRVRDLEGYEWTFGTHRPGEEVIWSGEDAAP